MLKQTITYKDFNGTERTDVVYFNLSEFEVIQIQINSEDGIQEELKRAVADEDSRTLLAFVKDLIHKAYGIKSEDGRNFDKSPEIIHKFETSALYSDLLISLFKDEGAAMAPFFNGLFPADLVASANAKIKADEEAEARAKVKPSAKEINRDFIGRQNIPEPEVEPAFNEAPAIGKHSVKEEVMAIHSHSQDDHNHVGFRVQETPMEASDGLRDADERANYEAWRAQQQAQQSQ